MGARCCGATRQAGGIYSECRLSLFGKVLEEFLIDPPVRLDTAALAALGVKPIGVALFERNGTWHVLDWVGSNHYRNVADFLEEVRHMGMSRRLPVTLEFEKLTPGSRHIVIHARGWLDNAAEYQAALAHISQGLPYSGRFGAKPCPRLLKEHNYPSRPQICAQVWWQDVEGGAPITPDGDVARTGAVTELISGMALAELGPRAVTREIPSGWYRALRPPDGVKGIHVPAMVASFPIKRLAVIRDPAGGTHERAAKAAGKSGIMVEVADE